MCDICNKEKETKKLLIVGAFNKELIVCKDCLELISIRNIKFIKEWFGHDVM